MDAELPRRARQEADVAPAASPGAAGRELRGGGCGAGRARGAERGRAGLWRLLRGDAAEPGMMGKGTAKGAPAGAAALCLPAARWLRPRVCLQPEQPRCKEGKAAGSSRGSRAPGSGCRARGREGSEQLERNKTRKKKKKKSPPGRRMGKGMRRKRGKDGFRKWWMEEAGVMD